jgi:hypothetical protein
MFISKLSQGAQLILDAQAQGPRNFRSKGVRQERKYSSMANVALSRVNF